MPINDIPVTLIDKLIYLDQKKDDHPYILRTEDYETVNFKKESNGS